MTTTTPTNAEPANGTLPPGWRMVRFGDVVRNVDINERSPLENGFDRFVGLDHLDPESLHIKRWGQVADGTTFTRKFVSGQVLFGKRRAYQRKAAVAEFEGICSGDILVFEPTNGELIPELLPFIVQSDGFFNHALGTSAGSLSPRTKWKDLANYEFALPPHDEQRRIAEILWAADEAVEKWLDLRMQIDRAIDAHRSELFEEKNSWSNEKNGALFEIQLGKMLSPTARQGVSPRPYLGNSNVQWGRIALTDIKEMDFDTKEFIKFSLRSGDILVCEGGEVGRTAIWNDQIEGCCYQKALHRLRPINNRIDSDIFIHYMYHASRKRLFAKLTGHSTIAHLTAMQLRHFYIPILPISIQKEYVKIFRELCFLLCKINDHINSERILLKNLNNRLIIHQYER